ncbi:MAG: enoyl-CoA hydratase/isomerase family protein [Hyphomicrobiaceae bacterium]
MRLDDLDAELQPTPEGGPELLAGRRGTVGHIRLNRPKALNSLSVGMVRGLDGALRRCLADPEVSTILLSGTGERALCAGGDIRALVASLEDGPAGAEAFWRDEYHLVSLIARSPKPYVALMDGITMGGGMGMSMHARHRIVTERSRLAMPECLIGFFPDVGGSWRLSHAPGELGTYLGLTGVAANASDSIRVGLADAFVPIDDLAHLVSTLEGLPAGASPQAVDTAIARHARPPVETPLAAERAHIDRLFAGDRVDIIVERLAADDSDFARETLAAISANAPMGLVMALRLMRLGRLSETLEECLARELAAGVRMVMRSDFREGVRAVVIDKDRQPKWQPASLDEVDPGEIDGMLTPLNPPLFPDDAHRRPA